MKITVTREPLPPRRGTKYAAVIEQALAISDEETVKVEFSTVNAAKSAAGSIRQHLAKNGIPQRPVQRGETIYLGAIKSFPGYEPAQNGGSA